MLRTAVYQLKDRAMGSGRDTGGQTRPPSSQLRRLSTRDIIEFLRGLVGDDHLAGALLVVISLSTEDSSGLYATVSGSRRVPWEGGHLGCS